MDTLTSIKVFRQVVESGAFTGAAERLDLSTAMVSKHVMHVERRLGVRLLNRNNRRLSLTEAGRIYFDRCKRLLDDLEATELELGSLGAVARGTLRITCPSWFSGRRLADILARFRSHCPEILVDASFEDRIVDVVEEGYDLALRVTTDPNTLPAEAIARPVRSIPFFVAASREYLERRGAPQRPEDLANHDGVAAGNLESWVLTGPEGRIEAPFRVAVRYRSMAGVENAVAASMGLAPLPWTVFEDPVFKDRLVPVLTDYIFGNPTLYLIYVSRKYVPLKLRAFIDFFVEATAKFPTPAQIAASARANSLQHYSQDFLNGPFDILRISGTRA
jgi:DNA-binding transcriptional LysR family regulator